MKRLVAKFGKYYVATFFIMALGIVLFLLTPLLLWLFDLDSDILGILIFIIGLLMFAAGWIAGKIIRKKPAN